MMNKSGILFNSLSIKQRTVGYSKTANLLQYFLQKEIRS
jgi:hypothetical protein